MSSHPTDRGVRAYARRLSVSPAAVRKGVAEGRIPIGAEGRILPDAADAALARGVVSGPTVSRTLAEARRRKLAASVRLLDDELAELRANSVTPADLKRDWLEACRLVAAEVERTFGVNVPRTEGDAQTGFPCAPAEVSCELPGMMRLGPGPSSAPSAGEPRPNRTVNDSAT